MYGFSPLCSIAWLTRPVLFENILPFLPIIIKYIGVMIMIIFYWYSLKTITTPVGHFFPGSNYISNKITDIWEFLSQCLVTIATFAGLFSYVGIYISKETIPTMTRLLSTVCKYMTFQLRIPPNRHVTIFAYIWFLSGMGIRVTFQIRAQWKILVTQPTLIYLFSSMCK